MKRVFTFIMVAMFAFAFSSCKKNYTCTCIVNGVETKNDLGKITKSDAESSCDALNNTASLGGGSCSL